jgi:hypothetical protein
MEKTVSKPQMDYITSGSDFNLFMGGTGSGKTFGDGLISYKYISQYPQCRGIICANTYDQLSKSTMFRIREVWKDIGVFEYNDKLKQGHYVIGKKPPPDFNVEYHNFENYNNIISFRWGTVVFIASLDNYEALSGIEVAWAILDETWMTKEEAVKEVILHRLRQPGIKIDGKDVCPMYISTTPARVAWINDWFRLDDYVKDINDVIYDKDKYFHRIVDNKNIIICSIYHNKHNLTEGYIEKLINEHTDRNGKLKESGKRLIFANPFVRAGGEFYSSFDRITHTGDVPYIEGLPIHIAFDFNVVPYITMTVWQVQRKDNLYLRQIDEFCLKSPLNKTEKLCQEFERHYSSKLKHGLFYYGDATGKNQDTRGLNDYQIVENSLRNYLNNYSKRVPYRNPSVSSRRQFINNIFDEKYPVRILIDKKCKETIRDLEFTKEDATGHKLKEKVKDELTGQTYEALGHTGDSLDYLLTNCEILKDIYNKEFK